MAEQKERGGGLKVLTMKILVDKKSNKVLYGEANKEVVDFLVNLLTLPIGTVARLLEDSDTGMVGCAAKIYNSVETIDASYLHNDRDKNKLLLQLTSLPSSPPNSSTSSQLLLDHKISGTTQKKYYRCPGTWPFFFCGLNYISEICHAKCPECQKPMWKEVQFVKVKKDKDENEALKGCIVKGLVTYMVMDDLSITPLSMIAGISILNKHNVASKNVEERSVEIGTEEGLKLLKASLQSTSALSDVFLLKKGTFGSKRFLKWLLFLGMILMMMNMSRLEEGSPNDI